MVTFSDALNVLFPNAKPGDRPGVGDYMLDGSGIAVWNLPDPQPTADELAAVTQGQVDAARTARQRAVAYAAALSADDGTAVANRAAESAGATRDNDLADTLAALADLLGVTPEQLAARIAARRATVPPPPGAPSPEDAVSSATNRLGAVAIMTMTAAAINYGAGDPMSM